MNKKPSSNLFHVYAFVLACVFLTSLLASLFAQEGKELFVKEYKVGAKDLLEIKVFELPELSQTVRVSEDGSISLPLVGRIEVQGLTKDAVEAKLAGLLEAKYLKNAQVSVFIKEYQSQQVAVIGAVEKPGTYELVGRMSLLQVISQAGGFKENASNEIFVLREGRSGNTATIGIDLKDLLLNGNQKLNIPLMPSDIINVPVDQIIKVFVFGEVRNPGALQVKMSEKITLLQAIAQAGGMTEDAAKSRIIVKRKDPRTGKETETRVNIKDIIGGKKPDIILREGDVVYVPETIF
ncbi:MAG: polysaccharide biosynthesis/export family protein [Acidobacteriota bacterium]